MTERKPEEQQSSDEDKVTIDSTSEPEPVETRFPDEEDSQHLESG